MYSCEDFLVVATHGIVKNAENAEKGDRKGRKKKKGILQQ